MELQNRFYIWKKYGASSRISLREGALRVHIDIHKWNIYKMVVYQQESEGMLCS
jgi:hypothetical protein